MRDNPHAHYYCRYCIPYGQTDPHLFLSVSAPVLYTMMKKAIFALSLCSVVRSQMIEPMCCEDGQTTLRSLNGCTQYYACWNGQVQHHQISSCTNGLLFNETSQSCDYAEKIIDSCDSTKCGAPSPAPVCQGNGPCCPPSFTGYLPIDQCTKFYQCINGVLVAAPPGTCPAHLRFDANPNIQRCEENVQGCMLYVGGAEGYVSDTLAPTTPTPTVPSPPAPTPAGQEGRCCPKEFTGSWPEPGCGKFYNCNKGVDEGHESNTCYNGLLFNPTTQACDFSYNFECPEDPCNAPVPSPAPTTPIPVQPGSRCCPEGFTGSWPESGCELFYNCNAGQDEGTLSSPCSGDLLFNPWKQECDYRDSFVCPEDPCNAVEPTPSAPSPVASPVAPTPPGPSPVAPTPADPTPTEPTPSAPSPVALERDCPEGFAGFMPMEGCAKFYRCPDEGHEPNTCGPGTLFNVETQQCEHADSFECEEGTPTDPTPSEPTPTAVTPTEPTPSAPTPTAVTPTEPTPSAVTPTEPTPSEPTPTGATPTEPTSSGSDPATKRDCPAGLEGFMPMEGCAQFYPCPDLGHEANSCGPGTLFNFETQNCEFADTVNKVDCRTAVVAPASSPSGSSTQSDAPPTATTDDFDSNCRRRRSLFAAAAGSKGNTQPCD